MNGQNPVFESPFCARCQVVRADNSAVDHLDAVWHRAAVIEGIEHHLSPDTLETLADLTVFFEQHPEALAQFKASRKNQLTGN